MQLVLDEGVVSAATTDTVSENRLSRVTSVSAEGSKGSTNGARRKGRLHGGDTGRVLDGEWGVPPAQVNGFQRVDSRDVRGRF